VQKRGQIGDEIPRRASRLRAGIIALALSVLVGLCVLLHTCTQRAIRRTVYTYQETNGEEDFDATLIKRKFMPSCPRKSAQAQRLGSSCSMPRFFVLRGREPEEIMPGVVESWASFQPEIIYTRHTSEQLSDVPGCMKGTWEQRLFAVYLTVFGDVLRRFPDERAFVFLEDDALLLDADAFQKELCWQVQNASTHRKHFFSFYRTAPPGAGCFYHWGTQAFLMNRAFLEYMMRLPSQTWCRFPIDIFINTIGPWYMAESAIVEHVGRRLKLGMD
jgi:hypothetical protein